MIRIIITFGNQISVNQFDCRFNFLAFFIVFEWGRILESAMDK